VTRIFLLLYRGILQQLGPKSSFAIIEGDLHQFWAGTILEHLGQPSHYIFIGKDWESDRQKRREGEREREHHHYERDHGVNRIVRLVKRVEGRE